MWREVGAVKRNFKDIQTAMKNEIAKMGMEIITANKDISVACNGVNFTLRQAKNAQDEQLANVLREADGLKAHLATLKVQYESARHEINERDQRIAELSNQLKKLDERCGQAESQAILANRYNDEIERLNNSIREIAQAVVQDAEIADRAETIDADLNGTGNATMQHMHLSRESSSSAMAAGPTKSPRRSSTRASQAFAEGTISAVQAALHKYQLALHDMQVKYQNNNENLKGTKAQLEQSEATNNLLTSKITQLTEKLDASNSKLSELFKERDSLQKTFEDIRQQKQHSEKGRAEINAAVCKTYKFS